MKEKKCKVRGTKGEKKGEKEMRGRLVGEFLGGARRRKVRSNKSEVRK